MEAGNIDKDIFRMMLQIAYRRLLVAEPGKALLERVAAYSPRAVVRMVVEYAATFRRQHGGPETADSQNLRSGGIVVSQYIDGGDVGAVDGADQRHS